MVAKKRLSKKHRRKRRRAPGTRRQRGGALIPKLCIQTAKEPIDPELHEQLAYYLKGWDYTFFTDADILAFFTENPHDEYKDISEKFTAFTLGEHKADLFRYYYLFLKGGVFIDADLMLYEHLNTILAEYEFVSVRAIKPEGSVFNGFLAATPAHPIIVDALNHLYKIDSAELAKNYTAVVSALGTFVDAHPSPKVKLLKEITNNDSFCFIEDPDTGKVPMIHYQNSPIPKLPIHSP
jgi:mannosyltransferase OCH1-like enzyme